MGYRVNNAIRRNLILLAIPFLSHFCVAQEPTVLRDRPFLLSAEGQLSFTNTTADSVNQANYSEKFTNLGVGGLGLGVRLFRHFYLGGRYEFWLGQQQYTLDGVGQTNTLNYQGAGGEVGWYFGNPRMYYLVSFSALYPLQIRVASQSAILVDYSTGAKPLVYEAKLTLGVKLNSVFAVQFLAGYREANLGNLTASGTPFIGGGGNYDLSGPFIGLGLGIHF